MSNANMQKLDFAKLDSNGVGYQLWVSDVEDHLTANGILATIRPPDSNLLVQPTPTKNAQALILIRRHIDDLLRKEYNSINNPRTLWVVLEERFGNIQDTLFDLKVKWNDLRFSDFKTISEYNSEALCIKSMLKFCGEELTDKDLIEKTLSTFPVSALLVSKQYWLEYNDKRITRFHQLINAMLIAEKHDNILVKNYNSRPVGTKSVHEANYGGAFKEGCKERNPKAKENQSERVGPYNRPTNDGNRQNDARPRGNNGQHRRGRVSAAGRGGAATDSPRDRSHAQGASQLKEAGYSDEVCYRCGSNEHWFKRCKASEKLAAQYKAYRDMREQEAYLVTE
ncbi:putative transcription factor interactor and regulator CCHC(Zn) family [Rosa chinensis]|uniref:Putative transcription factor interactor and regulator CCHC(Zn) family n=1 Tax=Rosa chinensis TaxID=74649 RepID=A0A2P6RMW7_ROSCH|nr:uncharacterized protein LOC112183748 [Rosa chinensis]PRQ47754.1 putative transcription factor interactor and regulator CCHC(Zn) family [Rosa chinensis]